MAQDAALDQLQASVEAGLRQRGATAEQSAYVHAVVREQHDRHRADITKEGDLRRALQKYVAELEVCPPSLDILDIRSASRSISSEQTLPGVRERTLNV